MKPSEQLANSKVLTAHDVSANFEFESRSNSTSKNIFGSKQITSLRKFSLKKKIGNFSRSTRRDLFKSPETPGPGHYEILNTKVSPSYSFRGKSKEIIRFNPGPGAYCPNSISSKKGIKIGKSQRLEYYRIEKTPGPGHYEKPERPCTPSWVFSKDYEKRQHPTTPGPGSYESKTLPKGSEHSTTKSSRSTLFHTIITPGPGAYKSSNLNLIHKYRLAGHNLDIRQKCL